jgi:putative addiction module component (TIGR02574 family)
VIPIQDIDFSGLSPTERILLAQQLWDSVVADDAVPPPTPEQCAELDRRVALLDAGDMATSTWAEVKARLLNQQ